MRKEVGNSGEVYSAQYLINQGYGILHRNYRTKFGEMDIVAQKNNCIIFVEVKTRQSYNFGLPRESVNLKKQTNYYRLANHYIQSQRDNGDWSYRFDVIEVYKTKESYKINHIENAF